MHHKLKISITFSAHHKLKISITFSITNSVPNTLLLSFLKNIVFLEKTVKNHLWEDMAGLKRRVLSSENAVFSTVYHR